MADAFVLAAGDAHGRLAELGGTRFRALIEVGGRPMVERVLTALRGARKAERIAVVAPPEVQGKFSSALADLVVPPGDTLLDNLSLGLEALGDSKMVMFAHADAPLVTAEAFDDFLERAEPMGADLAYAIVARADVERRFPRGHRTYARVREGVFTGSNVVLVRGDFIARHRELIRQFYQHRKNPLRLVGMLGPAFMLRLVTGRLGIAHIEQRLGQIFGGAARAVISRYPELAFDVDKAEDLEIIRQVVGE